MMMMMMMMIVVLSSWQAIKPLREFIWFIWWKQTERQVFANHQTKSTDFFC